MADVSNNTEPRAAAPAEPLGQFTCSGEWRHPGQAWVEATLAAAEAIELKDLPAVQGAITGLFRIIEEHKSFFAAYPHLTAGDPARAERCQREVEERWKAIEPALVATIVPCLTACYATYGYPVDAGEQASALHLHSGGGSMSVHAQGGLEIGAVRTLLESSLLEAAQIIKPEYL